MMVLDSYFNNVFDSLFNDTFDSAFGTTFKAPKIIKSMTDTSFPQSNIFVNKDTKECMITVCLPGISESECRLDRNDNVLTLEVYRGEDAVDPEWVEMQSSFSIPQKSKLSWKLDPSKYDLDHINVSLENGLMLILIKPTESAKPKKISGIFGSLEDKRDKKVLVDKSKKKE